MFGFLENRSFFSNTTRFPPVLGELGGFNAGRESRSLQLNAARQLQCGSAASMRAVDGALISMKANVLTPALSTAANVLTSMLSGMAPLSAATARAHGPGRAPRARGPPRHPPLHDDHVPILLLVGNLSRFRTVNRDYQPIYCDFIQFLKKILKF
jgi:hypothetical protein